MIRAGSMSGRRRGPSDGGAFSFPDAGAAMAVVMSVLAATLAAVLLGGVGLEAARAEGCLNASLRTGLSASLPDCRGFEQVSPEEKGGFEAPLNGAFEFTAQAASNGKAVSFMSVGSIVPSPGSGIPDTFVSSRTSGWQTASVTPPTPEAPPTTITEYGYGYNFSEDLSNLVLKVPFQSLAPESERATPGAYNLFLRHANGSYALVTAASPATPPKVPCLLCFEEEDISAFMGANAGTPEVGAFTHILFEVNERLLTTPLVPSEQFVPNLYESNMEEPSSERVHPVGVLPDGTVTAGGSVAGAGMSYEYSSVLNTVPGAASVARAISNDGSHVLFQTAADGGAPDPEQAGFTELYDRINGSSTIEISAPAAGAAPTNPAPGPASYWTASVDGRDVFFTSPAELTSASKTGPANEGNDLYMYDVEHHDLTDLTVDTSDTAGAAVMGVVGASEDGSYVYFVAGGQLEAGHGVVGEPNLYVWHEGVTHFIATLNPSDASLWTATATEASGYVTPDGHHLAFASVNQITSYDNRDQNEPARRDREVYEYDATTPSLACASCNSSGARPVAEASIKVISTPFYHPRILSDDGSRLFFTTGEPLEGASNGGLYEYSGGAEHLIAPRGAYFLDASASGDDVFFATRESLVPGDEDKLTDVYDARVDGGTAPQQMPSECEGSDCRGQSSAAPAATSPSSSTFFGSGNLAPPAPVITQIKPPTRAQLLAKSLKACKKLKTKKKQQRCAAAARKRYAPKGKKAIRHTVRSSRIGR